MPFTMIKYEQRGRVALVTLDRLKALNALSSGLLHELAEALAFADSDKEIHVVVLAGGEKAFAAGADIKEMSEKTGFWDMFSMESSDWDAVRRVRKPVIAAVAGYALGGGCELMMMCDIVIAADNAKFGQPEITLATIPGIGGTQRLTRAIGKAKAMDMVLTGRMMDVEEAERAGLVSRIVKADRLIEEALEIAGRIASFSLPSVLIAKECVNAAQETSLQEGLRYERGMFCATFSIEDRKEGMSAFIEKREPSFRNQ